MAEKKDEVTEEAVEETKAAEEETKKEENKKEEAENKAENEKITELENKIKEWEDKYTRLYAEYDNYQKRSRREKDARYADAVVDIIAQILPVADNLDRALATEVESEDAKKVLDGVNMVKKQMNDILAKLEVSEIAAVGEVFDPNVHNAVMHVEDEDAAENTVVEEFMKGYKYKDDRVIRHSMVKVAN